MTDPFAPQTVVRPRQRAQTLSHAPIERLKRLGASRIVLSEVQRRWATMSTEERREATSDFDALADEELRPHMVEMEIECVALSVTDEPVGEQVLEKVSDLLASGEVPTRTVGEVATWVRDDAVRALAALTLELREGGSVQRSTLIDALRKVLDVG